MELTGLVLQKRINPGSKSEHDAVMLRTDQGEFVLRRAGGNPFHDPEMRRLVGKRLVCECTQHGSTLIMTSWRELD